MLKKIDDMNYYELLEVSYRATPQEIHKAYERTRKIYDPNSIALYSLFSPEETEKIRQRVEEAYRTLLYEDNRRVYDMTLRETLQIPELEPPVQQHLLRKEARPVFGTSQTPVRVENPVSAPSGPPVPVPHAAPSQEPLQPAPTSITEFTGAVLKILREQKNMSLQNIADITKVSARYFESIEAEAFSKLPARAYIRGFLTNYAKALGYEPERIVSDYMKRYELAMTPGKK